MTRTVRLCCLLDNVCWNRKEMELNLMTVIRSLTNIPQRDITYIWETVSVFPIFYKTPKASGEHVKTRQRLVQTEDKNIKLYYVFIFTSVLPKYFNNNKLYNLKYFAGNSEEFFIVLSHLWAQMKVSENYIYINNMKTN